MFGLHTARFIISPATTGLSVGGKIDDNDIIKCNSSENMGYGESALWIRKEGLLYGNKSDGTVGTSKLTGGMVGTVLCPLFCDKRSKNCFGMSAFEKDSITCHTQKICRKSVSNVNLENLGAS